MGSVVFEALYVAIEWYVGSIMCNQATIGKMIVAEKTITAEVNIDRVSKMVTAQPWLLNRLKNSPPDCTTQKQQLVRTRNTDGKKHLVKIFRIIAEHPLFGSYVNIIIYIKKSQRGAGGCNLTPVMASRVGIEHWGRGVFGLALARKEHLFGLGFVLGQDD